MPISSKHPEYQANYKRWEKVRKVVDNDAQEYLRKLKDKDVVRLQNYKESAILTNFTALTLEAFIGLIFKELPEVSLPTELEYMLEDATGDGRGLIQLSQQIMKEMFIAGRCMAFVDVDAQDEDIIKNKLNTQNVLSRIVMTRAERFINWGDERINNEDVNIFNVIHESRYEADSNDIFEYKAKDYYRLLILEDGVYKQKLYKSDDLLGEVIIRNSRGQPLTRLPNQIFGSRDNNLGIDKPVLEDIALMNLGHYRNSADEEEMGHIVAQPTLFMGGEWTGSQFKEAHKNGIYVGAKGGNYIGPGSWAQYLQVNPTQLISEMMKDKVQRMIYMGARVVTPPGGRETAESVRLRHSAQNSIFETAISNFEEGIENLLRIQTQFQGGNPEEVSFKFSRKFAKEAVDPQAWLAMLSIYDRNLLTKNEMRENLIKSGVASPATTEQELSQQEQDNLDLSSMLESVDNVDSRTTD